MWILGLLLQCIAFFVAIILIVLFSQMPDPIFVRASFALIIVFLIGTMLIEKYR
jgi:hypothetical protein